MEAYLSGGTFTAHSSDPKSVRSAVVKNGSEILMKSRDLFLDRRVKTRVIDCI